MSEVLKQRFKVFAAQTHTLFSDPIRTRHNFLSVDSGVISSSACTVAQQIKKLYFDRLKAEKAPYHIVLNHTGW